MPELGIIFAHFTLNEATRVNLESFRRWHTEGPVLTVTSSDLNFEGGCLGKNFPLWEPGKEWYHADYTLYQAYLTRQVDCRRWFYVEWDCHCNMPVREYLRHVWDFDFAAPSVRLYYREPEWAWFQQMRFLPEQLRPYAMGVVPLNGIMLSNRALSAIVAAVLKERLPIQSEFRIGTLGHACGFPAVANPLGNSMTWSNNLPQLGDPNNVQLPPGIWHPIKFALPRQT
jgi:hypothetical protein